MEKIVYSLDRTFPIILPTEKAAKSTTIY